MKINSSYIIYGLIFLCILFVLYLIISNSNTQDNIYYTYPWNNWDGSNNLWYGLNAGGDYRGYGREYGGHLSPRRIYGKTHTQNHMEHHMENHIENHR